MLSAAPDDELMAQAAADRREAFQALAARLRPVVKAFLFRLGCRLAEVEDLSQETLIRLWVHRRSYRPGRPVRPYVLSIAKNAYLSCCRSRTHSQEATPLPEPSEADRLLLRDGWQAQGPEAALFARYREFRLAQAVAALPPTDQLVFVLRHHEGLKYHEVASVLDIAEGTAKSRMFRAVRALRRALPDLEPGRVEEESHDGL